MIVNICEFSSVIYRNVFSSHVPFKFTTTVAVADYLSLVQGDVTDPVANELRPQIADILPSPLFMSWAERCLRTSVVLSKIFPRTGKPFAVESYTDTFPYQKFRGQNSKEQFER